VAAPASGRRSVAAQFDQLSVGSGAAFESLVDQDFDLNAAVNALQAQLRTVMDDDSGLAESLSQAEAELSDYRKNGPASWFAQRQLEQAQKSARLWEELARTLERAKGELQGQLQRLQGQRAKD
jgi:hypothetical protein